MFLVLQEVYYGTNFGVYSAKGAVNTKIGFLKAHRRWAFKKQIFLMRIAVNGAAILIRKPILGFAAPKVQQNPKLVLLASIIFKERLRRCDRAHPQIGEW